MLWRFAERTGAQIVAFIVQIVLARIIAPEAYGTIALITVFTTILQVFVDSGLGNALIQKKDADNLDFSTVFFTNVIFCIVLYIIMFFVSPMIARFYKNEELVPLIRVLSLTVLISGVKNVQQAYVSRNLIFKKFFFSTLAGTIIAAIVGIYLAYSGYGVWALVAQQIVNLFIDTLVLWITVKWRPEFAFSFERLKCLFNFGWKLLVSAILDRTYTNLRQLIIGKMYSSSDLAFYNRGEVLPNVVVSNINTSIDSVLLPAMSSEQNNCEKVKNMTRRAIKTSTFIMAPLMMGFAACAPNLIKLLLTDKWLPCVPYLRICCITYMFYPIHTANLNAIQAMGRSDLFLKLEVVKKIMGFVLLLCTMWFGVMAMAYSLLLSSVLSQIINSWPNKKLLNYRYLEQLKDIFPTIIIAILMGIVVVLIDLIPLEIYWFRLLLQIFAGVIIYIFFAKLTRNDSFEYIFTLVKNKVRK